MTKRVVISLIIFLACFLLIGCFSPAQNDDLDASAQGVTPETDCDGQEIEIGEVLPGNNQNQGFDSDKQEDISSLPEIKGESEDIKEKPATSGTLPEEASEEARNGEALPQEAKLICTLSISCSKIWDNLDKFDENKKSLLPEDGYILAPVKLEFSPGETGFDVLLRECISREIHMEYNTVPLYKSKYVKGIGNIYEFDCGELSGWIYRVNDKIFNTGSSNYQLEEGDIVQWVYSCDLGRDVGFQPETEGGEN